MVEVVAFAAVDEDAKGEAVTVAAIMVAVTAGHLLCPCSLQRLPLVASICEVWMKKDGLGDQT